MSDRLFYPLAVLVAVVLTALALVWPQGQGARSPKPFGHATWASTHKPVTLKSVIKGAEQPALKGPL